MNNLIQKRDNYKEIYYLQEGTLREMEIYFQVINRFRVNEYLRLKLMQNYREMLYYWGDVNVNAILLLCYVHLISYSVAKCNSILL